MKEKVLCDRCKREFEADEDDLTYYDYQTKEYYPVKEIICEDCKLDSIN